MLRSPTIAQDHVRVSLHHRRTGPDFSLATRQREAWQRNWWGLEKGVENDHGKMGKPMGKLWESPNLSHIFSEKRCWKERTESAIVIIVKKED